MSRVPPLSLDEVASVSELAASIERTIGWVPTSLRVMARHPRMLDAFLGLTRSITRDGTVDRGLKQLVAQMVSAMTGCNYCRAHTGNVAAGLGVPAEKVAAVFEFETDPRFTPAERAALRLARDSAVIPNAVTDAHFEELRAHFSDGQIVEIVAMASLFAFLNRFNDTLANELEPEPTAWASEHLVSAGWELGKHGPA